MMGQKVSWFCTDDLRKTLAKILKCVDKKPMHIDYRSPSIESCFLRMTLTVPSWEWFYTWIVL